MADLKIVELGRTMEAEAFLVSDSKTGNAKRMFTSELIGMVRKELGYMVRVLEKCSHCGQYGAVMCACPSCGAPIDPKE